MLANSYDSWVIGVRGGGRGGAAALSGLKNFRANSVFRATASSSKILNNKIYFNTVKNSRATLFSGQAQVTQNNRIIKNIFNTAKIFRAAQVAQKSWIIKNTFNIVNSGHPLFFRASASCSKILNVKSIFHKAKNFWATLFFRASASC